VAPVTTLGVAANGRDIAYDVLAPRAIRVAFFT
jgi:hypothetical protein